MNRNLKSAAFAAFAMAGLGTTTAHGQLPDGSLSADQITQTVQLVLEPIGNIACGLRDGQSAPLIGYENSNRFDCTLARSMRADTPFISIQTQGWLLTDLEQTNPESQKAAHLLAWMSRIEDSNTNWSIQCVEPEPTGRFGFLRTLWTLFAAPINALIREWAIYQEVYDYDLVTVVEGEWSLTEEARRMGVPNTIAPSAETHEWIGTNRVKDIVFVRHGAVGDGWSIVQYASAQGPDYGRATACQAFFSSYTPS